jgi:hypothetical protein
MDTTHPEYIPATQLADECGMGTDRGLRSLRQWLHRNHREALARRPHPDGGERLMVRADAAEAAREHFGVPGLVVSREAGAAASMASSTDSLEAARVRESASPASTEPAALALAEAKGRAEALLEAAVDRALRAEAGLEAALRRVGELERAVGHYAQRLRAWRLWAARVVGVGWWRRRRLPDTPEALGGPEVEG